MMSNPRANGEHQNPVDLRLVRYAVTLAEELHFGRAAARLVIAQQTLSAQIGELEHRLGVLLFLRDRRSVELTAAGKLFVEGGRRLLADAADLVLQVTGAVRPVRLDEITEGLIGAFLAQELRVNLPEVLIEIVQTQGLTAGLRQLQDGDIDLTFGRVHGYEALPRNLQHQLVSFAPLGVVLAANHPLAQWDQLPVDKLSSSPLLVHTAPQADDWADWIDCFISRFGLAVGRRLHGHGRGAVNSAVSAYGMPALGPLTVVPPPGLVLRPLCEPIPLCPVSVVWAGSQPNPIGELSGDLARVIKTIIELAEEWGWRSLPPQRWWLPDLDLRAFRASLSAADLRNAT